MLANEKRKNSSENQEGKKTKSIKTTNTMNRLTRTFFNRPCLELARDLLGKVLVRKLDNDTILKGYIVEMEAYPGGEDKASSTHNGRRTEANEPLYMEPGTAYVYLTYGMYHCFNISAQEPGSGVFIRALEPLQGAGVMQSRRLERMETARSIKDCHLCNGPSKLCISMNIDKKLINKTDLCSSDDIWLEDDGKLNVDKIVECKRIGIDRVEKNWSNKLWRFYIYDNNNVTLKNKNAEEIFCGNENDL